MSGLDTVRLAFVDGAAIDVGNNRLYVAAGFSGLDLDASRMLLLVDSSRWMSHDLESRIVSVDANRSKLQFLALGRNGLVSVATENQVLKEWIPDAGTGKGKIGYVSQIRVIDDYIYVCGDLNQVYRRDDSGWLHIDDGILLTDPRAVGRGLNGIDGTAGDDIYVVGDRGVILHYDGRRWEDAGSPTNCSLERVRCVSRDEVYICGAKGTFLGGSTKRWRSLSEDIDEDIWGLEYFQGKVYLATQAQLLAWTGTEMQSVKLPGGNIKTHRLTATEKSLWSIGVNDICSFDGRQWSLVRYPGNE